ncbi:enkurin-like [Polypterus senegalus]|nr:enkurin-like [Polypterus senegalus]
MDKSVSLYKTMGPAKVEVPSPQNFLRKHSKEKRLPQKKPFKYADHEKRKPPIPPRPENPLKRSPNKKNFIASNAMEVIKASPKKPPVCFVDSRKGDRHLLETSGIPKFINKKGYGEIPEYIVKIKEKKKEYETYLKDQFYKARPKQLHDEDRQRLLYGLKKNWEELNRQYLCLPVLIDTNPVKQHKQRLEHAMDQLEKDIKKVEEEPVIYIDFH